MSQSAISDTSTVWHFVIEKVKLSRPVRAAPACTSVILICPSVNNASGALAVLFEYQEGYLAGRNKIPFQQFQKLLWRRFRDHSLTQLSLENCH